MTKLEKAIEAMKEAYENGTTDRKQLFEIGRKSRNDVWNWTKADDRQLWSAIYRMTDEREYPDYGDRLDV